MISDSHLQRADRFFHVQRSEVPEMRKLISVLAVLLLSIPALAGSGYYAGFEGVPDICTSNMRTRESTIAEYCGNKIDGGNDWKDTSGANLLQWSEALDNVAWTKNVVTVTADQVRLRDGTLGAEKLEPTGADAYLYQDVAGTVGQKYFCLFDIRSEIGNVSLSIHAYDQAHGTILGTQAITVTPHWQLFRVEGTLVSGDTHVACTLGGNSTWSTGEVVYAGRAWLVDEDVDSSFGVYHRTDATTKPRLNLAPTNAPTSAKASMQGVDGNRSEARDFDSASDQYYWKADNSSMDMLDGDFTFTVFYKVDDFSTNHYVWAKGNWQVDAGYFQIYSATQVARFTLNSAGSNVDADVATTISEYHVFQAVRSGNTLTVYQDGTTGSSVDCTGEGIDGNGNFVIGASTGGAIGTDYDGHVVYLRIDAEALSAEERAYDREVLSALASNQRTNALSVTRATTAYTEFDGASMSEIAVNGARVGGAGGGLLVEGQSTNLILQSQDFSTTWATMAATISTDVAIAPDGQTTVDGFVGAAADVIHGVVQNEIDLTADSYVQSAYAKPGNKDWLYLQNNTLTNVYAYFNIANGFVGIVGANATAKMEPSRDGLWRCWIVFTGTAAQHTFLVYSAEADGDNQFLGDGSTINTYVWQAQVEKGTFPTTIIPTTTVPVTRNADSITLDPHPSGKPEARALPEKFEASTVADKLTVYAEFKCEWSTAVDIGEARYLLEISGAAGTASAARNRFQISVAGDGRVYTNMRDDASTNHYSYSGVDVVPYDGWFSIRAVFDFADFSRQDLWVNESNAGMSYGNNSGSGSFDTTDTLIRVGQYNTGGVNGFCHTRNPRIVPGEVRP